MLEFGGDENEHLFRMLISFVRSCFDPVEPVAEVRWPVDLHLMTMSLESYDFKIISADCCAGKHPTDRRARGSDQSPFKWFR